MTPFAPPDVSTVRLCSLLLSIAFAAVFLALWRGRRAEAYLLHWAASSVLYAGSLLVLEAYAGRMDGLLAGLCIGVIAASNALLLSGLRQSEGRAPLRPWMALPVLASFALPMLLPWLGALAGQGLAEATLRRAGGSLGLLGSVLSTALAMLRRPAGGRGRRIAAFALLAYVPCYVLSLAGGLLPLGEQNWAALLPLLSDQLLLPILYLSLLAIPLERAQATLRDAAFRDHLTGAWNRAGLETQQQGWLRQGGALLLLDIDHFKQINDRHGHAAGDAVLASMAARLAGLLAESGGVLARLGGDEFLALLPGQDAAAAGALARRLCQAVAEGGPGLPRYTISLGLAVAPPGQAALASALAEADAQLYRAKRQGRNRLAG